MNRRSPYVHPAVIQGLPCHRKALMTRCGMTGTSMQVPAASDAPQSAELVP